MAHFGYWAGKPPKMILVLFSIKLPPDITYLGLSPFLVGLPSTSTYYTEI